MTMAFHIKHPRNVPSALQGAVRTLLFAGEHSCRDMDVLFPGTAIETVPEPAGTAR